MKVEINNQIILTVGPISSGKSTVSNFIKNANFMKTVIISSDDIYLKKN